VAQVGFDPPLERGPLQAEASVMREVERSGEPAIVAGPGPRLAGLDSNDPGLYPAILAPLRSKERTLGILSACGCRPRTTSPQGVQFLTAVGHQLGAAVENAQLAEQTAEIEAYRELDRLRSEWIGNVSHELRTPLGLIKLFSSTLLRKDVGFTPETEREFLGDIAEETGKLENIVDNLLDTSRLQSGRFRLERRETNVGDLVHRVIRDMQLQTDFHQLSSLLSPPSPVAVIDGRRIEQVLRNLLNNAIKYSPGGGSIQVQGGVEGRQLYIRVADQGIGIPPDDLERVFERFYRVDNPQVERASGVGVGLAVSRAIVQAHGGRIWVESTLGRGSTFYFTIPLD
jgi:K+-sensing histidine kinase KdpD